MVKGACTRVFIAVFFSLALQPAHAQLSAPTPSLSQDASTPETPMLQVHVREVLIPVVVRDAQGHAIGDLKQGDFKVFDQGKPRKIAAFSVQQSPAAQAAARESAGDLSDTAQQAAPQQTNTGQTSPGQTNTGQMSPEQVSTGQASPAQASTGEQRTITFLFDDRHLGVADLEQVKSAGMKMLETALPLSDRGLVLSFLGVNSGLTHSRPALLAAVAKLKVNQTFRPAQSQCPGIDYYQADEILNKHDDSEFKMAVEKAMACNHNSNMDIMRQLVETNAMEALQTGDQDVRETLAYIRDVVHTISTFPGQRTLILISPGFLSGSNDALALQSQILDLAAAAHVTISALDARGLFAGQSGASQGSSLSISADIKGQAQQDSFDAKRANEQIMAALADGTGGSFIHNSNDLKGGLEDLAAGPDFIYTLDLSLPDVKANGTYHPLKVEVDRSGARVQARQGYFAPFPAKK